MGQTSIDILKPASRNGFDHITNLVLYFCRDLHVFSLDSELFPQLTNWLLIV
jgi:hypothetical protein